jgi:ppGpp synthetase/RelA/SpoT-type nucleotidyltranferase
MERVIHARKLRLEGRRDGEARRIYERSPGVEDQIELLMVAAKLWAEFGHERKAKTIYALAKEMKGHLKRSQDREKEGRDERFEQAMHRVEKLEQRVERLTHMVEELHHMVRELHRER